LDKAMTELVNLINHDDVMEKMQKFVEFLNSVKDYNYKEMSKLVLGNIYNMTGYVPSTIYIDIFRKMSLKVWDQELTIEYKQYTIQATLKQNNIWG